MSFLTLNLEHCIYSSYNSDNFAKQIECMYNKAKKMTPTIIPDRFKSLLPSELGVRPYPEI